RLHPDRRRPLRHGRAPELADARAPGRGERERRHREGSLRSRLERSGGPPLEDTAHDAPRPRRGPPEPGRRVPPEPQRRRGQRGRRSARGEDPRDVPADPAHLSRGPRAAAEDRDARADRLELSSGRYLLVRGYWPTLKSTIATSRSQPI